MPSFSPGQDVTDGGWTDQAGGTSLFPAIGEEPYSDATFAQSSQWPRGDMMEVLFTDVVDPQVHTGHVVRYRLRGDAGTKLTVSLMCGATVIASWTHDPAPTTTTEYDQALSVAQATAIANYGDLRLRVVADQTSVPVGDKNADFLNRLASPGVVYYCDFNDDTYLGRRRPAGGPKPGTWWMQGYPAAGGPTIGNTSTPYIDYSMKCSGLGSLRFDLPSESAQDGAGAWFTEFSPDMSLLFGAPSEVGRVPGVIGSHFFVQFRQRYSREMLETEFRTARQGWWIPPTFVNVGMGGATMIDLSPLPTVSANGCAMNTTAELYSNVAWYTQWPNGHLLLTAEKSCILTTGDIGPGVSPYFPAGEEYASCEKLELVVDRYFCHPHSIVYNECGAYIGMYEPYPDVGASDWNKQNRMPVPPGALQSAIDALEPNNIQNALPAVGWWRLYPDEWITFQVEVKLGERDRYPPIFQIGPGFGPSSGCFGQSALGSVGWCIHGRMKNRRFINSEFRLWQAREGQYPADLILEWAPGVKGYGLGYTDPPGNYCHQLCDGEVRDEMYYGDIWFLPYMTNKDPSQVHPTASIWYDELIVSNGVRIPDPQV